MASSKPGTEKRRHPRFTVSLPMEYWRMVDPCHHTGLVINLSKRGILFSCRHDLKVGAIIDLTVMFADGFELTSLDASAKIIWKKLSHVTDWNEYKYGAEFVFISKNDQEKLTQLLNGKNLDNPKRNFIRDRSFYTPPA